MQMPSQPGVGDGAPKLLRKLTVAVVLEPVFVTEACADLGHGVAQRQLQIRECEVDGETSGWNFKALFTTSGYRSLTV